MTEKEFLVGTIDIKDKVDITDPGYDRDVWCRIDDVSVLPGKYNCKAVIAEWDDEYNGASYHEKRVKSCQIFHEDFDKGLYEWERIGHIGVDAGLAGFFPSPKPDYDANKWREICDWTFSNEPHNPMNIENDECYIYEGGFFTSSGFGDGSYDVYSAEDETGRIIGLTIIFIEED